MNRNGMIEPHFNMVYDGILSFWDPIGLALKSFKKDEIMPAISWLYIIKKQV